MKTFLEEFGLVGSAGQSRVTFPCSFDVSTRATQSLLRDGVEGPSVTSAPGTPDLLSASDSGASSTDNITSDTMPTFRIALPAAAIATDTITLYRAGSVSIGTGVLDGTDISNGYVDITASTLSEAAHTIAATCTNAVGESSSSSGLVVTVDTSAPSAPTAIIVTPADQGSGDTQTENTQPTFRILLPGNAVATDVVTLEIDAVDDATASLTGTEISNGYVDIQSSGALTDNAAYDISAFITDLAGNEGASSSAVEVEVGTPPAAGAIPAVIYDGVGDYLLHTGGPSGAAGGRRFTFVIGYTKASDGSPMTLLDIPGTVPFLVEIQADNTIDAVAGTAGAVASCSTTETTLAADGFSVVVVQLDQNHLSIDLRNSDAQYAGTNTPGTAADIDFTADWYIGSDGGADNFFDGNVHFVWAHFDYIGGGDAEFVEQFYDTTNDKMRDLGTDGSNPLGGVTQPILCHSSASASHTTNKGIGGNADGGSNSGDGTSPGALALALDNGFDVILSKGAAYWSMDHSANTTATGFNAVPDRLGSMVTLAQTTAAEQPLRIDTSGKISADWANDDDMLSAASVSALNLLFAGGGGFLIVVKPESNGHAPSTAGRLVDKEGSGGWITFCNDPSGGNLRFQCQFRHSGTDLSFNSNQLVSQGNWHVLDFTVDTDLNLGSDFIVGIDGANLTSGSGITTVNATGTVSGDTGNIHLGNRADQNGTLDGEVAEVIFFGSRPTSDEMDRVRTQMGRKHTITLS